jgi:predicted phosphodiesterase
MRTLIISDLHLGSVSGADLLRREEMRASLLEALHDVDRLVLLGDVLELRHGPPREAMAAARPFFQALGRALGERELLIAAGNHDHALIEPWLVLRGRSEDPRPLAAEQLLTPQEASPMLAEIAAWASPAHVRVAYPGVWLRDDVYATHGHYLDCHLTVPTLERLSMAVMSRVLGRAPEDFRGADDYEAVGSPVFAWRDAVARDGLTGDALNGIATVGAWRALGGGGDDATPDTAPRTLRAAMGARRGALARDLRRRALVGAFPLAVAALNRAGLGPLSPKVSGGELRRAGLRAMGEVARRLDLRDSHVIFGHTHRAGPLAGDRPEEWIGAGGARLTNVGSWTYSSVFLSSTPGESPYWPGACVLVEDSGAPIVKRLLQDRSLADMESAIPPGDASGRDCGASSRSPSTPN